MKLFILDACALIAVLAMEKGAENIRNLFQRTVENEEKLLMNKFNFLEVYYRIFRLYGKHEADKLFTAIKQMPIIINESLTDDVLREAGRLKVEHKISIADSIAIAETIINNGSLVTSDHHEIEAVELKEKISVTWFR